MLSASIGGMPHGGHAMMPQRLDNLHNEQAIFGGPPRATGDLDYAVVSTGRFFTDSYRRLDGGLGGEFGAPPKVSQPHHPDGGIVAFGGPAYQNLGYSNSASALSSVSIAPQSRTISVILITFVHPEPVMVWYLPSSTLSTSNKLSNGPTSPSKSPPQAAMAPPSPPAGGTTEPDGFNWLPPNGTARIGPPTIGAPPPNFAYLSSIPTAAQIISPQTNAAGSLPTTAVDTVLQSIAGRLLLTAAMSGDYSHVVAGDVSEAAVFRDALDDFIELDAVAFSDDALPLDAVERERIAVDAVLGELHDLDSLAWDATDDPATEAEIAGIELQLSPTDDAAVAAAALADSEGGMVMLETRGNPNDSVFDLVGAAAEPDLLQARAGVEAAVGFYQALDVATDEVPTADVRSVNSDVESAHESRELHRPSTDHADNSSNGTAAAVGATFLGGLLWLGRAGRSAVNTTANTREVKRRPR